MFRFSGKLTDDNFNKSYKQQNKDLGKFLIIADFIAVLVSAIVAILIPESLKEFLCLNIIVILSSLFAILAKPLSKVYKLSKTIIFDSEKGIISVIIENANNKPQKFKVKNIKKIEDYGDWYYIRFKFDITASVVCQKNLIVEGTIEDFEKLFADKIIRKY